MWNARLDVSQAGIKIAGRNINLWYADDTTVMTESKEELKIFLMTAKKEIGKDDLKLSIQKMKIMASGPITSWQIDGEKMDTMTDFLFCFVYWTKKTLQLVTAAMKFKDGYSL